MSPTMGALWTTVLDAVSVHPMTFSERPQPASSDPRGTDASAHAGVTDTPIEFPCPNEIAHVMHCDSTPPHVVLYVPRTKCHN